MLLGIRSGSVAEGAREYGAIPEALSERHVQAIWYDGLFRREALRTTDGAPVEVLFPGLWNEGPGPDFRSALIRFGGLRARTVAGDVEVHRAAADWERHGHDRDPAYDRVALHVSLRGRPGDDRGAGARHSDGTRLPEVRLADWLDRPLEELLRTLRPGNYPGSSGAGVGRCHIPAAKAPPPHVAALLERAGWERLAGKAGRLARRSAELGGGDSGWNGAVYEALVAGLGYVGREEFFLSAARAVPWPVLRPFAVREGHFAAEIRIAEAVEAGPPDSVGDAFDPGSWHRAGLWRGLSVRAAPAPGAGDGSPGTVSQGFGIGEPGAERGGRSGDPAGPFRPVGAVRRRLGAVAVWAGRWPADLARAAVACSDPVENPGASREFLCIPAAGPSEPPESPAGYWSCRSRWGPPDLWPPQPLLGPEWATLLWINVLVPLRWARDPAARAPGSGFRRHVAAAPAAIPNHVTREVRHLLGGPEAFRLLPPDTALRQQGMHRLHARGCHRGWAGCLECPFPEEIAGE